MKQMAANSVSCRLCPVSLVDEISFLEHYVFHLEHEAPSYKQQVNFDSNRYTQAGASALCSARRLQPSHREPASIYSGAR
jgi:hypothetical protein